MMVDYETLDIAELLIEAQIDPLDIEDITAVWGDNMEEEWYGGCCFSTFDEEFFIVEKSPKGIDIKTTFNDPYEPPASDYDSCPYGVVKWIDDGAHLENSHEF